MPDETRRLHFSNLELYRALLEHSIRRGRRLPSGRILKVSMYETPRPGFAVVIDDDLRHENAVVRFDLPSVAAALITYCRSRKVPLPRRASKSLTVVDRRICLDLTITHDLERPDPSPKPAVAPGDGEGGLGTATGVAP
jgi:hypothetical protein